MTKSIHGHDVIRMMQESGLGYTRDTLVEAIRTGFGPAARFHTCSAQNLTAEGLVDFLEARGKFRPAPVMAGGATEGASSGAFTIDERKVCSHEEPHEHA